MLFREKPCIVACLLVTISLAALFAPPRTTAGGQTGAGPANKGLRPQAAVTSLAFDPLHPGRAYAGTTGRVGLWTSDDNGRSWHAETGPVANQPAYALLASRSEPGMLFAATGQGLFERLTSDTGWQKVAAVPSAPLHALAEDKSGALLAAGSGPTIYLLRPGRSSWEALAPLPFPADGSADGAESSSSSEDPPAPGAVLALATARPGQFLAGTDGRGLFKSDDAGQTWRIVPDIPRTHVAALSVATDGSGLARTRAGLFRTADGDQTWQASATGIDDRIDALAPFGPNAFLIGTGGGDLYRSIDRGATWQRFGEGTGRAGLFFVLAPVPSQPNRWLAGRESGLYQSADGAVTWQAVQDGPGYPRAGVLASGAAGALFLGTGDGIFRSDDGGESWESSGRGLPSAPVLAIGMSPANPEILYAGLDGAGLYRSADGGATWNRTGWKAPSVPGIALDPRDPDHVFIRVAFERVYESRDAGKTWTARWTGLGLQTQIIALAVDAAMPSTLFAGATEGFFRSQDGAATWQSAGRELAGQTVFCIAAGSGAPGELYAGSTTGIYRSSDGGQHWERWGRPLAGTTVTAIAFRPGRPAQAFAGTPYDGLWMTTDGGRAWQPLDPGMRSPGIRSLAFSADGRWLVAATDLGVYRVAPQ